jgi:hypothetical protein
MSNQDDIDNEKHLAVGRSKKSKEDNGDAVKRRRLIGYGLLALCGIGVTVPVGLKVGGAVVESAVDAKADAEFIKLTGPVASEANAVLSTAVIGLQQAKPAVAQFLSIVQTLQQIGVNDINSFLTDLQKIPYINTTNLQKFTNAVNTLLKTEEDGLGAILDNMEQSILSLEQRIAETEQNAQTEIHKFVAHEVHSLDFLAPGS